MLDPVSNDGIGYVSCWSGEPLEPRTSVSAYLLGCQFSGRANLLNGSFSSSGRSEVLRPSAHSNDAVFLFSSLAWDASGVLELGLARAALPPSAASPASRREGLADLILTADVSDRSVGPDPSEHDFRVLLGVNCL
jgi:hypothetical protein